MQTLKGRTCIFTGATAGDGRDVVKALCMGGMNVVMMTHNDAEAQTLIEEVKAMGAAGVCTYRGGNGHGKAEENTAYYDEAVETFGSVDVIIHNGGGNGHIDDVETLTEEGLMREVQHLLGGAFGMMHTAIPYLKKSKAPRVIFMSSVEGIHGGTQGSLAVAVGKGAVASLTKNAAARLVKYGITVNCVAKGAIPRVEGVRPGDVDPAQMLPSIPMGRLGTSQDLAGAVCFLASEESSYVTGQVIDLSGGLNLGR